MSDQQPASEKEARPDNDLPPTGDEAQAQRTQTVMPLIWAAIGLLVVLVFVAVLASRRGPAPAADAASNPVPAAAAAPGR
jgi:hypothetical protein